MLILIRLTTNYKSLLLLVKILKKAWISKTQNVFRRSLVNTTEYR